MAEVLVAGSLHLDVIVDAERFPRIDETLRGRSVSYAFGGKGGNQAVAAARMGAAVAMAGRVGDDRFGDELLAGLDRAGIDRGRVGRGAGASGMSVAIVDARGDYGAVVVSGVNQDVDAAKIDIPPDLPVLVLQNEIPTAANVALARRCAADTTLVVNAAPAREMPPDLMTRIDVLVVNRLEAAALTGGRPETLDAAAAAARLQSAGARAVVVTLGAEGLVCAAAGSAGFARPAYPVRPVSSHGAGDMFTGALAARLAAGDRLADACEFARIAAALHVSVPPHSRETITRDEVRRLMARAHGASS